MGKHQKNAAQEVKNEENNGRADLLWRKDHHNFTGAGTHSEDKPNSEPGAAKTPAEPKTDGTPADADTEADAKCSHCEGSGKYPVDSDTDCKECLGTGNAPDADGVVQEEF